MTVALDEMAGSVQLRHIGLARRDFFRLAAAAPLVRWPIPANPTLDLVESPTLSALQAELQLAADRAPGIRSGLAALDMRTGLGTHVNGRRRQAPGCTLNLLVLLAVAQDLQAGAYPVAEVDTQLLNMVRFSNAVLAHGLLTRAGGGDTMAGVERVRALAAEVGMRDTVFDHPPAYSWTNSLNHEPNTTTAVDMVTLLSATWHERVLDDVWTRYVLEKMTQVSPGLNYLIPAGLPRDSGAVVGHKNGWFTDTLGREVDNDVGLVWRDSVHPPVAFAIATLFESVPANQHIGIARAASGAAWNHLSQLRPDYAAPGESVEPA